MIVHPELHALRGDDSPQRDAQKVISNSFAAWRARPEIAMVLSDLEQFSRRTPLALCQALAKLFKQEDNTCAAQFARSFLQAMTSSLAQAPLGHLPLRHYYDDVLSTLMIDRSAGVTLSITAIDGSALSKRPADSAVRFCPKESWEVILSGNASAKQITRTKDRITDEFKVSTKRLKPGMVLYRDELLQSQILEAVTGTLVTLRLQRNQPGVTPVQEFDLETGNLVNQTAASSRESRHEMMLALLGRMKREEAAQIMADMALEQAGSGLRWQSLRECLALDTALGFRTLTQIAGRTDDPLMPKARALQVHLTTTHPQLRELELCLT